MVGRRLPVPLQLLRIRNLPLRDRAHLARFALARRLSRRKPYAWRLPGGTEVYFSEDQLYVDLRAFAEVFFFEDYRASYEGAVVIDVGAHKGYFGAYALLRGARVILAYEPERENFRFLEQASSSFGSRGFAWRIHRAAVGAQDGHARLHLANESWAHSVVPAPGSDSGRTERVPLVSMRRILEEAPPGERLIVKVDAEGAESNIVLATPPDAWQRVDEIFVEVHAHASSSEDDVVEHLRLAGLFSGGAYAHIVHAVRPHA